MTRIEHLPPQLAVGKHTVVPSSFSNDAETANLRINTLWSEVLGQLGDQASTTDLVRFAITTPADNEVPPLRINYIAAVVVGGDFSFTGDLDPIHLEGGRYVVFPFVGALNELDAFYRHRYLEELPSLGFSTRDGQHLEKILRPPHDGFLEIEAWIPITE